MQAIKVKERDIPVKEEEYVMMRSAKVHLIKRER